MVTLPLSPSLPPEPTLPCELTLPRELREGLRFTPEQFAQLCEANPDAVLELSAEGHLIEMTPTGGDTGARNTQLTFQLQTWANHQGGWIVFDSSSGFRLGDGSVLSPDASAVRQERWQALTPEQRAVEIWRGSGVPAPAAAVGAALDSERLEQPSALEGGDGFPGLRLELVEIWAV
jgi:hypothetical protein